MITGHLGVAWAVHAARRGSSFAWLVAAAMAPDLLDGLFVAAGACNPYGLYTHTVPAATLLAASVGAVAFLVTDSRATGLLCAGLALAHLPLDYLTGHKLLWPGGELRGLRLYDWPAADFLLEAAIVTAGWLFFRRRDASPRWAGGWQLLVLLLALQGAANIAGTRHGGLKPWSCGRPSRESK